MDKRKWVGVCLKCNNIYDMEPVTDELVGRILSEAVPIGKEEDTRPFYVLGMSAASLREHLKK